MPESVTPLVAVGVVIVLFIVLLSVLTNNYSLNGIKSKTVGDGQHGTARWATTQEVKKTFANVPFDVASWRAGKNLPEVQGLILGSTQRGKQLDALVDRDDVHCLMIGASGVGKTAFFLYPNLEFACASGMSYLALDTKGDLARNYGTIAKKYYGYHVSVIDLRARRSTVFVRMCSISFSSRCGGRGCWICSQAAAQWRLRRSAGGLHPPCWWMWTKRRIRWRKRIAASCGWTTAAACC